MKLISRPALGSVKIFNEQGAALVTFSNCAEGMTLYAAFVTGIAQSTKFSIFDEAAGQYIAGDVGQLAG